MPATSKCVVSKPGLWCQSCFFRFGGVGSYFLDVLEVVAGVARF